MTKLEKIQRVMENLAHLREEDEAYLRSALEHPADNVRDIHLAFNNYIESSTRLEFIQKNLKKFLVPQEYAKLGIVDFEKVQSNPIPSLKIFVDQGQIVKVEPENFPREASPRVKLEEEPLRVWSQQEPEGIATGEKPRQNDKAAEDLFPEKRV